MNVGLGCQCGSSKILGALQDKILNGRGADRIGTSQNETEAVKEDLIESKDTSIAKDGGVNDGTSHQHPESM